MRTFFKQVKLIAIILTVSILAAGCAEDRLGVRLYVMDGGRLEVTNMSDFSSEGKLDGQEGVMANPFFLIRHPRGDLIWDTGNSDQLTEIPDGMRNGAYLTSMNMKLIDQLDSLGLEPQNIDYLSLSHLHPDHSGNANLFKNSLFIVNELELRYMFSDEAMEMFGSSYSELKDAKSIVFTDDYDVFEDGTVIIKSMPGHTPGSSVLLVRLENSGNILLTGDLYTHARARELQTIPIFNTDKQATIDSRKKFEELALMENARVIIQHSKPDFDQLPKFPNYLD